MHAGNKRTGAKERQICRLLRHLALVSPTKLHFYRTQDGAVVGRSLKVADTHVHSDLPVTLLLAAVQEPCILVVGLLCMCSNTKCQALQACPQYHSL
jgi:hypothetical protein